MASMSSSSILSQRLLLVFGGVPNNHGYDGGVLFGQHRAVGTERLNMEAF